ncbi:unnamed protein product [Adineta steineri]|uniref:Uncharacterized protein n=1 Tax=Adineta steineri TaxID=433720 RepID=A0A813T248_9BILA|nr:unnamed protein product [Adineta steineri]
MEPKRITTRAMLQRAVNLTKQAHELQIPTGLTVPFWHNTWHQQKSITSDTAYRLSIQSSGAPTFALSPQRKFDFIRAQKFLQLELIRRCSRISNLLRYDPKLAIDLVRELSHQLRQVIKPDVANNVRYKIVVLATVVQVAPDQQKRQSMAIASRCLWNHETDGSVTIQTKLGYDMMATATIFAIYTD